MRLQLAVVEPAADPLTEAGDAETRKFVMPEPIAQRLEVLTGGWDSIGDLEGMRTLVARRAKLELRLGPSCFIHRRGKSCGCGHCWRWD
jgi:hypothetical protein